ncbi:MAG TPA: hypothetical protein VNF74_11340 [Terriglobales bacterium]|nr:hypothetical protein [Terriglobales bacterium]
MAEMVIAVAAVGTAAAALYLWATRHIVRDELEPLRQDIEVLRVAVFNHLTHGETPDEDMIRRGLGYGARK